ncbi:MAG: ATP-binding protein [Clostridiales bacterium]|nr:ATP-binding protein [Clostridiales bacterium]
MLLEFKAKNYKSYMEEMVFSMAQAPKQRGLDESVLRNKIDMTEYNAVCSAVVYGASSSGKSNIFSAVDAFKSIILRGSLRNPRNWDSYNKAAFLLEHIPNISAKEKPVFFSIKFIDSNLLFEYSVEADLGEFMNKEAERKIVSETLKVNDKLFFSRNGDELEFGSFRGMSGYMAPSYLRYENTAGALAECNIVADELFLTNGFKNIYSSRLAEIFRNWLESKLEIIFNPEDQNFMLNMSEPNKNAIFMERILQDAPEFFSVGSAGIKLLPQGGGEDSRLYSILSDGGKIASEKFESKGTIRFVNMFRLAVNSLMKGSTLIVDDMDSLISPNQIMCLLSLYHSSQINRRKAQLIFNSYNPIYLRSSLLRREEVKFTEMDEETAKSNLYSLSDIGSVKVGKKNEDFVKIYISNKLEAVKPADTNPIFKTLCEHAKDEELS